MSDLDLTALQLAIIEFIPQGRSGLLPALHAAQLIYGYLSEPVAAEIARLLNVPLADVYGVIDFYSMFYREPIGRTVVRICTDPSCALLGADEILEAACHHAGVAVGDTSKDGAYAVERSTCLGLCNVGVAVNVSRSDSAKSFAHVTTNAVNDLFEMRGHAADDFVGGYVRGITALCDRSNAATLTEYEAHGGIAALRKVLVGGMSQADLIDEIKRSGLVGRGGAAFPMWIKWDGALKSKVEGSRFFVVNADESEPGTFKDRILMERDPQRFIEGAILGAYAIGAHQAYIYIRGEYPTAIERVNNALVELKAHGYLGKNILGSGFDLEVEIRSGAGAYICGEETALFESIEGKRGFPRVKPPFPTEHGLFGQPTAINNVETLANVPTIIANGADAYKKFGTEKSSGSKLFCLSGDVAKPGLYEVPFGVTLRHLINDLAGGVSGGMQAILMGGAAGSFATEKDLDVKLSFEDMRAAGLPLGSGAIMVFNQSRDLRDVLLRLGRFFAHESCGKCYPCQLGTQRQYEVLQRVASGKTQSGDVDRLSDVTWTMSDASLCGLGQTAGWAVQSAMKLWPEMFR
ncbi:MAG TPA: NADH-quinone oxidoreductase subunit NuoF [Anaerolineae bacterium]|nr:NADH-quinone oxidoreductase subunit NuoF [Anaerolineae bacterium]